MTHRHAIQHVYLDLVGPPRRRDQHSVFVTKVACRLVVCGLKDVVHFAIAVIKIIKALAAD